MRRIASSLPINFAFDLKIDLPRIKLLNARPAISIPSRVESSRSRFTISNRTPSMRLPLKFESVGVKLVG